MLKLDCSLIKVKPMAWRIIVRIGLTGDTGSVVRNNSLTPKFLETGLQNIATGTWEGTNIDQTLAARGMGEIFYIVADPSSVSQSSPDTALKHLWVYLDNQPDPELNAEDRLMTLFSPLVFLSIHAWLHLSSAFINTCLLGIAR